MNRQTNCWLAAVLFWAVTFTSTSSVHAQVKDWFLNSPGHWSTSGNWIQGAAPSHLDIARIGSVPGLDEASVLLNVDSIVRGLEITNTNQLFTGNRQLIVNGDTSVSGSVELAGLIHRSRLNIENGMHAIDFQTDNLTINDAIVKLDGRAHITERLTIGNGSFFRGDGRVNFSDTGVVLRNNELIDVFRSAGPSGMTFNVLNGGAVDLDGTTGDGRIQLDSSLNADPARARFTINGGHLAGSFSGRFSIGREAEVDLNFESAWTTDQNSLISFHGPAADPSQVAVLKGADVTIGGVLNVSNESRGRVESDVTFANTAHVDVGHLEAGGSLVLAGETMIDGGLFEVDRNAELEFAGPTRVEGGTFNTFSDLSSDGRIVFGGMSTEWAGTANFNGYAQQAGDARVAGPTTINADVFDMDGLGGSKWAIDSLLTVNADSIDSSISNSFDGVLSVRNNIASELSINLSDPDAHWTMAGVLGLHNDFPFERTLISGSSRMRVTGTVAVGGALNRITADLDLASGSHTVGQSGNAGLVVQGQTLIEAGAQFTLLKTLTNSQSGHLTLADGVSLDETDLINQAIFDIGDANELTGIADVGSFENTEDAIWSVDIGGHTSGTEFDLLLVSDGLTLLDGLLEVELIDAGNGLFAPEVGDEFTILTSLSEVMGEFNFDPISFSDGQEYQWEVLYNPHDVTLRVASISAVPEPGTASILLVIGMAASLRRRRC